MEQEATDSGLPTNPFEILKRDVIALSYLHRFYRGLYEDAENIERMNAVAPLGFRLVQEALANDQIRMICALTDPPGSGGRQNAVLTRVLDDLKDLDPELSARCTDLYETLEHALEPIRQHRNKRLMHFDLPVKQDPTLLPPLLTDHLDAAVRAVRRLMEEASPAFSNGANVVFDWVVDHGRGLDAMIWLVKDGVRYTKLRDLARSPDTDPATLKEMVADRSGRDDPN